MDKPFLKSNTMRGVAICVVLALYTICEKPLGLPPLPPELRDGAAFGAVGLMGFGLRNAVARFLTLAIKILSEEKKP